jgi:hypothetical protein
VAFVYDVICVVVLAEQAMETDKPLLDNFLESRTSMQERFERGFTRAPRTRGILSTELQVNRVHTAVLEAPHDWFLPWADYTKLVPNWSESRGCIVLLQFRLSVDSFIYESMRFLNSYESL